MNPVVIALLDEFFPISSPWPYVSLSEPCYTDDTQLYSCTTSNTVLSLPSLLACMHDLKHWMQTNSTGKTDVFLISPNPLISKHLHLCIDIHEVIVKPLKLLRTLASSLTHHLPLNLISVLLPRLHFSTSIICMTPAYSKFSS